MPARRQRLGQVDDPEDDPRHRQAAHRHHHVRRRGRDDANDEPPFDLFDFAHPPFLPDFPNGYYRIDPTMDVDDAAASIHPSVFIRVLPAQAVDVYPPPSPA